jgi:hypothetical protein
LQIIREDQLLLVLMDVQKGYLEGSTWAIPHGRDAHPMNIAFQRIVRLLERLNDDVKIMSIQYIGPQFVNDTDKELIDPLIEQARLRHIPNFTKIEDNMMKNNDRIKQYFAHLKTSKTVKQVVFVGCTITSCLRLSALSLKEAHPKLNIFLDLYHCGGLKTRDTDICQNCLDNYLSSNLFPSTDSCGHLPKSTSSNKKAINDMKAVGIKPIANFNWKPFMKPVKKKITNWSLFFGLS